LFTGLIEEMGVFQRVNSSADGAGLVVSAKKVLSDLKTGDSIAVNGPCLTVTAVAKDSFTVWVMPETLKKTNLGAITSGQMVNLERAMSLGDRLGGHLVSGHIDDVVSLLESRPQGGATLLSFGAPENLLRYIVPKGSVALDGVSLTVIDVDKNGFSVGLIPHTASQTTLHQKKIGALLNLEVDLIGKYVEKLLEPRLENAGHGKEAITMNYLLEKGYL
jgi:riboflavin synthase